MVGRLDPRSGDVKLVTVPTPKANPYGMAITSKGVPYFAEFGANKLAAIDPQTMAIHEYPLPSAGARPRRIAIAPDDTIYYSDYRARLSRPLRHRHGSRFRMAVAGRPNVASLRNRVSQRRRLV